MDLLDEEEVSAIPESVRQNLLLPVGRCDCGLGLAVACVCLL